MDSKQVSEALSTRVNETSDASPKYVGLNVVTAFSTAIWCVVLILNGSLLWQFARNPRLRTPFAVYLQCLLGSHVAYGALRAPFAIVGGMYSGWILSSDWCTFNLYVSVVLSGGVMYSHVLISGNRIWAVTFPHSYRQTHSKRVASLICGVMWVCVHAIVLPGLVLDALFYRIPIDKYGCRLNPLAQPIWAMCLQFLIFLTPNVVMAASYPFVWYKNRQRNKTFASRTKTADRGSQKMSEVAQTGATKNGEEKPSTRSESKSFLVLTLLTAGVMVCWTPLNVVSTVLTFVDLPAFAAAIDVVGVLYCIQPALDPLFFIASLKDLKKSFVWWRRCGRK